MGKNGESSHRDATDAEAHRVNAGDAEIKLDEPALRELEGSFRGQLVPPGDPTYDEQRRVWNGSIDRSPALIVRCAGVADVIAAVRFARSTGLPAAVRGGGHSFPGLSVCDGGVVIDLGPMKGIRVDPEARTARAQAGVLWGDLDRETQAFGLATTGGIVTHTGVAGLTLGGGIGWLQRKHGLTIDQLLSVDLVTADGELVKASETENPDLFWGLRGGGGNFGIVTEFEFRLHPVGPIVLAGPILWPIEQAPALLRFYRDWSAEAPDELMTICDVAELSDQVIDIAVDHSLQIQSPLTAFPIWQLGGAVARVAEEETAFNGRGAGHTFNITGMTATAEGFDAEREWVGKFWSALEPHHTSVYVNFLMDEGQERVRQAYGAEKYDRLTALKRKYDPDNFFHLNQNIPPK